MNSACHSERVTVKHESKIVSEPKRAARTVSARPSAQRSVEPFRAKRVNHKHTACHLQSMTSQCVAGTQKTPRACHVFARRLRNPRKYTMHE
ncbi:hypothetical protein FKM82_021496 [Ascaphus truei]